MIPQDRGTFGLNSKVHAELGVFLRFSFSLSAPPLLALTCSLSPSLSLSKRKKEKQIKNNATGFLLNYFAKLQCCLEICPFYTDFQINWQSFFYDIPYICVLNNIEKIWRNDTFNEIDPFNEPGWLSQLGIQLRLRSWSHSLWVQAPHWALCWQLRTWKPALDSMSPSLSAPPSPFKNKH